MAYKSLVLRLLISAPSDVPEEDLSVVRKTISQWNLTFGRAIGLTVLPVSWSEHAATEFGDRPQEILNGQIVEESDLAIALFYDRLGTPTGEAASGTAEEIKVLVEAEKSVGVLVNTCARKPLSGSALGERQPLTGYLEKLREHCLVFEYVGAGELVGHLNNFLSRATAQFQRGVEESKDEDPREVDPSEGVWPMAEVRETTKTDSKGRIKTQRKWSLVLRNTSRGPASEVDFTFENLPEELLFDVAREDAQLGTIPPGGEARFPLFLALGSPKGVDCEVSWTDAKGVARETRATVRT
ncbi:hypothetical protein [Brevibacterium sp. RIT 803]|uniref:hypothetical protein n=1 Tax=Brevibacterium sp. RIT 803 TaxID=2810210 RepID=UPI001951725E|nr:hypothetical protein [Brevibacterium sp. RIT 803]MBM6588947.1 hypothetical protein [Brevibacterium sp. RIT 803]